MQFLAKHIILFFYKIINTISIWLSATFKVGYQVILPYATYAPWLHDNAFLAIYKIVKKNSLVNIYQCYELWQLVAETQYLNGAIIEIGTWRGASLIIMAKQAALLGKQANNQTILYGCDTFNGVVKATKNDKYYKGGEHKNTSLAYVNNLAKLYNLHNIILLKGIFPDETGGEIAGKKFRLCHIDVDTYLSAKDVFEYIWPFIVLGGVVVFNDYGFPNTNGITTFVNQQRGQKGKMVLHNLNGNGLIVKTE